MLDVDLDDPGAFSARRLQSDELSMPRHSRRLASDDSDIINAPYERVSVGLMDDPEIQQVFKRYRHLITLCFSLVCFLHKSCYFIDTKIHFLHHGPCIYFLTLYILNFSEGTKRYIYI